MASLVLPRNSSAARSLIAAARRGYCTQSVRDGDKKVSEKRTLQDGEKVSIGFGVRSGWRLTANVTVNVSATNPAIIKRLFTDDDYYLKQK